LDDIGCTLGFDAVSGELAGTVLNAMPNGSTLRVYGGLSEQGPQKVSSRDLIFKQKTLAGFWLTDYIKHKSLYGLLQWSWTVMGNLQTDFAQDVAEVVPLERIHDALGNYVGDMGRGKVLIDCWGDDDEGDENEEEK
jgi:NADPH:quinone reductase